MEIPFRYSKSRCENDRLIKMRSNDFDNVSSLRLREQKKPRHSVTNRLPLTTLNNGCPSN